MTVDADGSSSWNLSLVGHTDLGGHGRCMHINLHAGHAFVGHMDGRGTSILDIADPAAPVLVANIPAPPNTHSHKVQVVGDLLLVNRERMPPKYGGTTEASWTAGLEIYDISNPAEPRWVSFWPCGGRGVHRMTYWEHPYVYLSAGADGFDREHLVILDLSDPSRPREAGRWWLEGQHTATGEVPVWGPRERVRHHHGVARGNRLYSSWWDYGLIILDIDDRSAPKPVSHLRMGPDSTNIHTTCPVPGRDLLIATEEAIVDGPTDIRNQVYVVDIADEANPSVLSRFPVPDGDFAGRLGRFGPHNIHEGRPGSLQDGRTTYLAYFNAGIRVVDISDPRDPTEIAYYVPATPEGQPSIQLNDLIVGADGLIYVSDRGGGGVYILELDGAANGSRRPLS